MFFQICCILFCILETIGVYQLWFMSDMNDMLLPGNYQSYRTHTNSSIGQIIRLYATWVGNCKAIFIFLLMTIVFYGDIMTHFIACNFMILGCSIYFYTMESKIKALINDNELPNGVQVTLSFIIGKLFIPMFILCECFIIYQLYFT